MDQQGGWVSLEPEGNEIKGRALRAVYLQIDVYWDDLAPHEYLLGAGSVLGTCLKFSKVGS